MDLPPTPSQGPSGPLSGEQGPSGPLSGEQGPSIEDPPVEDQATEDQPAGYRPELTEWLAGVERRLEMMGERLARLESSIRPVVAEEVHGATSELRRAMSELGRRLVQDLPHELARHRDAIVAELRPPPPPPPPSPEPEEAPVTAAQSIDVAVNEASDSAAGRRAPRRRRRHG